MQKKKVLFHQNNAPCHKSMKTMVKLIEVSFESGPQRLLALSDLKTILQGKRFGCNEEVIAETEAYFRESLE